MKDIRSSYERREGDLAAFLPPGTYVRSVIDESTGLNRSVEGTVSGMEKICA
jgi:hypothetical protein